ncbi:MAG: ATP-binding protein [Bacillota bacterium]|nr:ATP-binding protein [Bacillota bacterium]
MPYIEGLDRNQIILFPESIDDYISEDNSVRIIDEYAEQLDITELGFKKSVCAATGRPPYSPKDLLKLYLYGYLNRVHTSRRLEHEAIRNIEVIWLLKKLRPDFKTIADFRRDNKKVLKAVFRDFTKLCDEWDLFGKELIAIDGSKFRTCNSKRNNYSEKKLERACRNGFKALFKRVPRLLTDIAISKGDGSYNRLMHELKSIKLLILDDWGLNVFDHTEGRDLLEVIEDRTQTNSTVILSQLSTKVILS